MISYQEALMYGSEKFKRIFGVNSEHVRQLESKIQSHIGKEHSLNPMKKRGRKSFLTTADSLLLTLYYLRNYPTFLNLGKLFGISESYACKIFHRISSILVKELKLTNRKELMTGNLEKVVIDVTEQAVERPVKKQKDYYSGKKKAHRQSSNRYKSKSREDSECVYR